MKISEIPNVKNFCRVFELPNQYPEGFLFGEGKQIVFRMVDWFGPIPSKDFWEGEYPETWEELELTLRNFLKDKVYLRSGFKYILITDFDKSFVFEKS